MAGYRKYDDHEQLVGRMADKVGVDMDEELQSGRVTPDDMQDIVYRCMSCEDPENCKAWLDSREGMTVGETPPYCVNQDKLTSMGEV